METKQIAILGTGSMGKAILAGLIQSGTKPANIRVSTKTQASADAIFSVHGVEAISLEKDSAANTSAVKDAELVILAVKPNLILETLKAVATELKPGSLVVSVAAGITTEAMEEVWGGQAMVVRAMPNTTAIVGSAVTGISAGSRADKEAIETAVQLFKTVGTSIVLDEAKIDALSTISGSGPAYVFYLIEQLTAVAKKMGFSDAEAVTLVNETFLGSAQLLIESGKSPQELRKQVTSPNGTTEKAIAVMSEANLEKMFTEATAAALARAKELAGE
jgi:pyrroline-5-carboxylate reductase